MIITFLLFCIIVFFIAIKLLKLLFRFINGIAIEYQRNKTQAVKDPEIDSDKYLLLEKLKILETELSGIKEKIEYKYIPGKWTERAKNSGYDLNALEQINTESDLVKIGYKTKGITIPVKIPLTEKQLKRKAVLLQQIYTLRKKVNK